VSDFSDLLTATRAVVDPRTSAADLTLITQAQPGLRAQVAAHPNAYPQLLAWIGQQAPIPGAARPRHSVRPWLLGCLAGVVVAGLVGLALVLTGVIGIGSAGSSGGTVTYEGPGFGTPEAAAKAFLDGLKNKDMDAMVATFAIESVANNCDYIAHLTRMKAAMPQDVVYSCPFPQGDPLGRQVNIQTRLAAVNTSLAWLIASGVTPSSFSGSLQTVDDPATFQAGIDSDFANFRFAAISDVATVDPAALDPQWNDPRMQTNVAAWAAEFGLNENTFRQLAMTFSVDGQRWAFVPEACRYHDRWYLLNTYSRLSLVMGVDSSSMGLFALDQ